MGDKSCPNAIEVDYTRLPENMRQQSIAELLKMDRSTRDTIETTIAADIAAELHKRLPRTTADFERLIAAGAKLGAEMSWDSVAKNYVVPGMDRALKGTGGAPPTKK